MNSSNSKNSNTQPKSNRLVGWLVSYAMDHKGKSFEIRAGRTFISASDLGSERQITVKEGSVNAAHLALHASPKHKVVVQDVFSDSGSYLTKVGSDKEIEVSGPVELNHGDWLRIGASTRFQVCLIDGPGSR